MPIRELHSNGLRFVADEAGQGDRVALLLHGFPESRFSWRHQLPVLDDAGWRAVAPDLRGYGDSDRPHAVSAYRIEHLLDDVAGMFDALPSRRRVLIGHDWGGLIAWEFAMRKVRPIDGLIILNVGHPAVFRRELQRSWGQRLRSSYMAFFQLPLLPQALLRYGCAWTLAKTIRHTAANKAVFTPEVLAHYRRNALRPGAMRAMLNYYRANKSMLLDSTPLPAIDTPTLMLWGERDPMQSVALSEGYESLVQDFTLHRLPHASHWVQQEATEEVNSTLLKWLTQFSD